MLNPLHLEESGDCPPSPPARTPAAAFPSLPAPPSSRRFPGSSPRVPGWARVAAGVPQVRGAGGTLPDGREHPGVGWGSRERSPGSPVGGCSPVRPEPGTDGSVCPGGRCGFLLRTPPARRERKKEALALRKVVGVEAQCRIWI